MQQKVFEVTAIVCIKNTFAKMHLVWYFKQWHIF